MRSWTGGLALVAMVLSSHLMGCARPYAPGLGELTAEGLATRHPARVVWTPVSTDSGTDADANADADADADGGGAGGPDQEAPAANDRAITLGPDDFVVIRSRETDPDRLRRVTVTNDALSEVLVGFDSIRIPATMLLGGLTITVERPDGSLYQLVHPEPAEGPTWASVDALGAAAIEDLDGVRTVVAEVRVERGDNAPLAPGDAVEVLRVLRSFGGGAGGGGGSGGTGGGGSGDWSRPEDATRGGSGAGEAGDPGGLRTQGWQTRVTHGGRLGLPLMHESAGAHQSVRQTRADRAAGSAQVWSPAWRHPGPTAGQISDVLSVNSARELATPLARRATEVTSVGSLRRTLGVSDATRLGWRTADGDEPPNTAVRYLVRHADPTWTLVLPGGERIHVPLIAGRTIRDAVIDASTDAMGRPLFEHHGRRRWWLTVIPTMPVRLLDTPFDAAGDDTDDTEADDADDAEADADTGAAAAPASIDPPFYGRLASELERSAPFERLTLRRGDLVLLTRVQPRADDATDAVNTSMGEGDDAGRTADD